MKRLIEKYRSEGFLEGACAEYRRMMSGCSTKKQMADLMMDANGAPFVARSVAIRPRMADELAKDFGSFANGAYIRDSDGFTSSAFFGQDEVIATTTLVLAIGCRRVVVPEDNVCEIHCPCGTKVEAAGMAKVYSYFPDGSIEVTKYGL